MHNFISSGFVTLGRGHLKGKVRPHYQFFIPTSQFRIINHPSTLEAAVSCCRSLCQMCECDFCSSSVEVGLSQKMSLQASSALQSPRTHTHFIIYD